MTIFVRKIQTSVKTRSLQRKQNAACANGEEEEKGSSSDWMPELQLRCISKAGGT